jgi:hypothetical protein
VDVEEVRFVYFAEASGGLCSKSLLIVGAGRKQTQYIAIQADFLSKARSCFLTASSRLAFDLYLSYYQAILKGRQ